MDRLIRAYHAIRIEDRRLAYAFAIGFVAAGTLLRMFVGSANASVAPFVTLYPAVLIAAIVGGAGPGSLAMMLATAAAWYFFFEPQFSFTHVSVELLLFILSGACTILVGVILQAAMARTDQTLHDVREGERRLRIALEAGHLATVSYNLKTDNGHWSPAFATMVGMPLREASFAKWLEIVHPDDRQLAEASVGEILRSEKEAQKTAYRILRSDGSVRWLEFSVTAIRDANDVPVGLEGFALDVTDKRREDERKQEIMREMHHRIKNVLAMVLAIARQTARQESSLEAFVAAFSGRLDALAATQDLMVREKGQGVTLAELLKIETAPFESADARRVILDGPDVTLPSAMVTPLGLVIHELTTNAAKYGSLAQGSGQVAVSWSTRANGGGPSLSLTWREQGGFPVTPPSKSGFGTRLITRMIRNDLTGEIEFQWLAQGLVCTLTVPLGS